jgi:excisionase family DNA binding protein
MTPMANPLEPLLTLIDVATVLKVSTKTVRRLVKAKKIPVIVVGGSFRVRPDDLKSYIALSRIG